MFLKDGKKFNPDAPFIHNDIQYPSGWARAATLEELAAVGVTEVPDPIRPDDRFYFVTENEDGTYTAAPRDITILKPEYKGIIDNLCGSARAQIASPGAFIDQEYQMAYDDAVAYQAAGYSGLVPDSVQCWADAKGWTAQQSADDIIATKTAFKAVIEAIRRLRLIGKASVDAAVTPEEILAAVADVQAGLAAL